ncbi:MAG: hypothetical protein EBU90_24145 [Proteobacteria bacterium]|nr:hypothetical protein [Pseudomonadota bacterium]
MHFFFAFVCSRLFIFHAFHFFNYFTVFFGFFVMLESSAFVHGHSLSSKFSWFAITHGVHVCCISLYCRCQIFTTHCFLWTG